MFQENCRLVVILGAAGIGKAVFAIKLIQVIQENFDSVIWRSLNFAPPVEKLLSELMHLINSS
jgi:KaiC/GvpD/RAD55 family RecA-like ATPase